MPQSHSPKSETASAAQRWRCAAFRTVRSALGGLRAVAEALRWGRRGSADGEAMRFWPTRDSVAEPPPALNPFRAYLDAKHEGPGIHALLVDVLLGGDEHAA